MPFFAIFCFFFYNVQKSLAFNWGLIIFWDFKIRMLLIVFDFAIPVVHSICPVICFVLSYSTMFTASTDKTLGIWDYETGTRIKKLKGHSSFVNSCFPSRRGPQYIVSGADDCTVKVSNIWETKLTGMKLDWVVKNF